jgi:hypothetical protein
MVDARLFEEQSHQNGMEINVIPNCEANLCLARSLLWYTDKLPNISEEE